MFLISQSLLEPFALGEGELDCVLDEAVATRTDDKGGSRLDAMLHYHVCCNATCMEGNPNVKGSSEVVQIGLNEADVFQTKLSTTTLSPHQGLFFVLYEEDLAIWKCVRQNNPYMALQWG